MAEWRLLRGWSSDGLRARLEALGQTPVNFEAGEDEMTGEAGWHHYHSEAVIAQESDGDEHFARARQALITYQFSEPSIVIAHFDPAGPLLNRRLLLEIQVFGLHYLCPCLVSRVREEPNVFGFRMFTAQLEAMTDGLQADFLAALAAIDTLLHRCIGVMRHGTS